MDLISRQAAIDAMATWDWQEMYLPIHFKQLLEELPSAQPEYTEQDIKDAYSEGFEIGLAAQPEQPSWVVEIEEEYKRYAAKPYYRKPLAKALYEVWKKHDREDAERRE